jgi:Amidohydrolase
VITYLHEPISHFSDGGAASASIVTALRFRRHSAKGNPVSAVIYIIDFRTPPAVRLHGTEVVAPVAVRDGRAGPAALRVAKRPEGPLKPGMPVCRRVDANADPALVVRPNRESGERRARKCECERKRRHEYGTVRTSTAPGLEYDRGELDASLDEFFSFCAQRGVPVVAHGRHSQEASTGTGAFASPQYWFARAQWVYAHGGKPLRASIAHWTNGPEFC